MGSIARFQSSFHSICGKLSRKSLPFFCHCFPRRNSYLWFCTFILGIMSRQDKLGVTSAIRSLSLAPTHYDSLVKFLGSASWDIRKIRDAWCRAVLCSAPILRLNGCPVLLGDGVKQSKEGRHPYSHRGRSLPGRPAPVPPHPRRAAGNVQVGWRGF